MRARIVVINPQAATEPPLTPTLVIEDGAIGLFCAGWIRLLNRQTLEEVSIEDVRHTLKLSASDEVFIYLSSVRQLPPGDLLSEPLLAWTQKWWEEVVAELPHNEPVARAS